MRHFLRTRAGDGVIDKASGAFTASFFAQHASRIGARADQLGQSLSIILWRLEPKAASLEAEDDGFDRRSFHQTAHLINQTTRAEDCIARLSKGMFGAALTATSAQDAQIVAERIEGILANTLIRGTNDKIMSVNVYASICQRAHGASIEETIAPGIVELRSGKRSTSHLALV